MLTDTTFWIDLNNERAAGQAGPVQAFLAANRNRSMEVSIVTYGELASGFENSAGLERWLRFVRVLSLPKHVAWEASRIERELSGRGGRLGENDNWIAATARAWGMPLVSRDRAFDRVPGLRVVSY